MDRRGFLDRIAARLGRVPGTGVAERDARGVPAAYVADALDGGTREPVTRFREELEALGGEVHLEPSAASAGERLKAVLDRMAPRSLVSWAPSEFEGFDLGWLWVERGAATFSGDAAGFRAKALAADVGVTAADFGIANTGSLVFTATRGRPRSVSLTPAVHIALLRRDRIVARLGEALKSEAAAPSGRYVVTGPSRTADIENDLSVGVHGPGAVVVIVWEP